MDLMPAAYARWNEALADEFFPPGHAGPVYLDPNDATLAELAASIGAEDDPATAFIDAVKETLWLEGHRQWLYWHDRWFAEWRATGEPGVPPMVALLACFVFASTRMFDDQSYYQPLAELLGVENTDSFREGYNLRVRHYWSALNRWVERMGRGRPTAFPQDIRTNVSLLLTQRFLSTAERAMLPAFFGRTRLVPAVPITIPEMEDHIRRNAHYLPEELKAEWQRHSYRFAEVASIEFESWTGAQSSNGNADAPDEATLLLALYFDRHNDSVQFPLAVTSSAAPAGEYFFQGVAEGSELIVAAIRDVGGRVTFDAGESERIARGPRLSADAMAALLSERVTLTNSGGFRLEREPAPIILFLPLSANSYIEAPGRRLPLGSRFSLLVSQEAAADPGVAVIVAGPTPETREGCPPGWRLYRDLELRTVPAVPSESAFAPLLARLLPRPQDAVIDLRGGIAVAGPTRAGRAWLACDPPSIVVSGATEDIEVQLHIHPADGAEGTVETLTDAGDGRFERPKRSTALPAGAHYLYATRGTSTIARQKLQLVSSNTPRIALRPLAHAFSSTAFDVVSARPAGLTRALRGGDWGDLPPTHPIPEEIHPPAVLDAPEPPDEPDVDTDTATLGTGRDMRPDRYRQQQRRRGKVVGPSGGSAGSLASRYRAEIAAAVADGVDSFKASDGTEWRVRYFEDKHEVAIGPRHGFVPCGRFRVSYD
jgi:hypothetical protein